MKNLAFLFLSLIYLSCKTAIAQSNSCEEELQLDLSRNPNWMYVKADNYYSSYPIFIKKLTSEYRNCLIGKDTSYITKYFGSHFSMIHKNVREYKLSKPCKLNTYYARCDFFDFIFDKNGKVKDIHYYFIDNGFPKRKPMKNCESVLREAVSKNWSYDSIGKHYSANRVFCTNLDSIYGGCFYLKDTSYISKMFGKHYSISDGIGWMPTKKYPRTMKYDLSIPCNALTKNFSCPFLLFYFDKKGKVAKAEYIGLGLSVSD